MDLLIRDATVVQVTRDRRAVILPQHDLLVQGNRIAAVQPTGQIDPSQVRQVIDAAGQIAFPGLINCHAHTPMVLFRGLAEDVEIDVWFNQYIWPLEQNLSDDGSDVYLGMSLGLAEMIRAGVTTVAEHYFYMEQAAQAVTDAGTRALLGWTVFSSGGERLIERTAQFARDWNGAAHGRIRTILAPHAPYTCTDDTLRATAHLARTLGLGIHIHAAETMGQTEASLAKRGQTPIEVLEAAGVLDVPTILAHVCGATDSDIERMSRLPVGIAHCPKTYLKLAMDIAPVTRFMQAGIDVGLGTDGACSNNTMNIWESLRLMAMMQKDRAGTPTVMAIPEALFVATRGSAAVIGQANELGSLEPGFLADIILLDVTGLHHQPLYDIAASLVYNTEINDVRTVIVDGNIIMADRQLLTIDEAAVLDAIRPRMRRLSQRTPADRIQTYAP